MVDVHAAVKTKNWIALTSENFTVLTDLNEETARQKILDLELFRAVVLKITNARPRQDIIPTRVFLFKRRKDFNQTAPGGSVLGFFRPSLRMNQMVFPAELPRSFGRNTIMYHEYVHYLLRDGETMYPKWYDEGLADMLGSIYVEDDRVIIGGVFKARIKRLSAGDVYVPLSRTVNRDDLWGKNRYLTSFMYSMSWAAINYMYTGYMNDMPNHGQSIPAYLALLNEGKPRQKAFVDAFGITPRQMEKEMFRFLKIKKRGVLTIPVDRFPFKKTISVNVIEENDIRYQLGYLLAPRNPKAARKLFDLILEDEPANHRALAGRAVTYQMARKWKTGLEIAVKAIDAEDYLTHLEYADMMASYCSSKKPPDNCEALRRTAVKHYKTVLTLDPDNPEGKLGLGTTLSILNESLTDALRYVIDAYELVPQWPGINYWRGHLHFQLGDHKQAATYLLRASNWTHDETLLGKIAADMILIDPQYGKDDENG